MGAPCLTFYLISRALWRPPGQYGPSLHRVINETAFPPKKTFYLNTLPSLPFGPKQS
jgi:hypothetical protein